MFFSIRAPTARQQDSKSSLQGSTPCARANSMAHSSVERARASEARGRGFDSLCANHYGRKLKRKSTGVLTRHFLVRVQAGRLSSPLSSNGKDSGLCLRRSRFESGRVDHFQPIAKTERRQIATLVTRRFDSGSAVHHRLRSIVAMPSPFKRGSGVRFPAEAPKAVSSVKRDFRPRSIGAMQPALNRRSGARLPAGAPFFAGSSSGRTPSFDLVNPGSNPGPAATPAWQRR